MPTDGCDWRRRTPRQRASERESVCVCEGTESVELLPSRSTWVIVMMISTVDEIETNSVGNETISAAIEEVTRAVAVVVTGTMAGKALLRDRLDTNFISQRSIESIPEAIPRRPTARSRFPTQIQPQSRAVRYEPTTSQTSASRLVSLQALVLSAEGMMIMLGTVPIHLHPVLTNRAVHRIFTVAGTFTRTLEATHRQAAIHRHSSPIVRHNRRCSVSKTSSWTKTITSTRRRR